MQGHTSRPQKYIIRRLIDPKAGNGEFHPDEVVDMSFDGFGLYWEADAVARCLKGQSQTGSLDRAYAIGQMDC